MTFLKKIQMEKNRI